MAPDDVASEVVREEEVALPPGDSRVQREAEAVILALLGDRLGATLAPRRIQLADRTRVEVDGVSDDPPIICEAWAHQGPPKSAQKQKVMVDALKLWLVGSLITPRPRLILALSDDAAARPFKGASWHAHALRSLNIEIEVVELPRELHDKIARTQVQQYR